MSKKYNVVIAGAQGYIGRELVNLVGKHPFLQLIAVHCRAEKTVSDYKNYSLAEIISNASQIDILFLATPADVSMEIVASLKSTKILLIDLSGAFRLPADQFHEWYGFSHLAPEFINEACYGLSPWVNTQANHRLIANPGCYAACSLMSLIPLLKANLIKTDSIIIDAKSGVSGAGKQSNPDLMFCELANNFYPYKIGKHQHLPEIQNALHEFSGKQSKIRLTTCLLPIIRGIAMTIYTEAQASFATDEAISAAIEDAYQAAYHDYPLVIYKEIGKSDDQYILSLKNVVHTSNSHIGYFVKEGQITIFSSIDNLLKGAASQAIENINAFYQLPLQTGLLAAKEAS
ncbi:MAG: N-acetyl-gamma-glutamyl-phosphate reductase [Tatlockia sp.]|nr:N-acetyl-gamma-glutamyl-phosphate reductase [Tatlockia sp.]